ncbi:MAG: NusG domain II-containing protein [Clostridiaceae bacterium]|nr:NusG domain II-containing protein [Clostridiaceae bacterium]
MQIGAITITTTAEKPSRTPVGRQPVRWYQYLKWGDWVLYALIGLLAAVMFALAPGRLASPGTGAVLERGGEVILTLSAADLAASGSADVVSGAYHYHLVYTDGRIRFAEADCPDKICVRTGWISRPGQIAACVPGDLILKLTGTGDPDQTDDVDVIVR